VLTQLQVGAPCCCPRSLRPICIARDWCHKLHSLYRTRRRRRARCCCFSTRRALSCDRSARTAMTTCRSFAQLGQNCKQPRLMRKMMKEAGAVLKAFVVVFRNNVDDLPLLTAGGSLGAAVKAPTSTIASAEWLGCADGTRRTQQRSRMQRTSASYNLKRATCHMPRVPCDGPDAALFLQHSMRTRSNVQHSGPVFRAQPARRSACS
jgi:hypothetical protein